MRRGKMGKSGTEMSKKQGFCWQQGNEGVAPVKAHEEQWRKMREDGETVGKWVKIGGDQETWGGGGGLVNGAIWGGEFLP